jgi:lysozyme
MTTSQRAVDLIKKFEGYFPNAYLCPAGVPTIGYGSTMWSDGKKVVLGQKISLDNAEKLLMWELKNKEHCLNKLHLNQNQFDALMSFVYNVGCGNLVKSTLYKKALINPNDQTIKDEFMKWNKARVKGVLTELKGLTRRRIEEAKLYYE